MSESSRERDEKCASFGHRPWDAILDQLEDEETEEEPR